MSVLTGETAVRQAADVAAAAHQGQTDKLGQAYVAHPARIVASLTGQPWQVRVVGWLHDVVEDTPVTLAEVRSAFGDDIADAVDAITIRHHESRSAYYARVKANAWALLVKEADIRDNFDPHRRALLDAVTAQRLRVKYSKACDELGLAFPASVCAHPVCAEHVVETVTTATFPEVTGVEQAEAADRVRLMLAAAVDAAEASMPR